MLLVVEIIISKRFISNFANPSLQCARFVYDELIKINHSCMGNELRMDKVFGEFLRDELEPSEIMIRHIIDMETDYINTSHPSFIGRSKAADVALLQILSTRTAVAMAREKKLRSVLGRSTANGITADQGIRLAVDTEKPGASAYLFVLLATLVQYFITAGTSPGYVLDAMRDVNESHAAFIKTSESKQLASSGDRSLTISVEGDQYGRTFSGSFNTPWTNMVMDMYPPGSSVRYRNSAWFSA
ncbi:hypothetical protein MKW98_032022 [Papaver atlanticum]|uniref:Dynamin stalk domain-containing protein n=1 Tax=Papaver atlanticum TaxID=357466 RepID=A0AAD4SEF8_9MAGN|nr:hypothetical protein MKW98_032022 [Papaver atlanticum]